MAFHTPNVRREVQERVDQPGRTPRVLRPAFRAPSSPVRWVGTRRAWFRHPRTGLDIGTYGEKAGNPMIVGRGGVDPPSIAGRIGIPRGIHMHHARACTGQSSPAVGA